MKVSVLIANYNNYQYIDQCINSILNQTYKNFEIIFFDDYSTDRSLDQINNFSDVVIIKNNKKKIFGSYNQINAYKEAFLKSTGDIVCFLDSDDYFESNKLELIIKEFKEKSELKVIFDLPIHQYEKKRLFKKNKNKIFKTYWPYIPPQSCISVRKEIIIEMLNSIEFDLFPNIWMDFRICIFSKYILNDFYILNKNLTNYRINNLSVNAKFKFLTIQWWKRRIEAHEYIKHYFKLNKIKYSRNLDFFLTKLINFLL